MHTVFVSPKRRQQRSGYVLIMTLVLITVAALSLSGLARRSLLLASESIEAQRNLQRFWGAHSCRQLVLERAEELFAELEAPYASGKQPWPAPHMLQAEVKLADMRYRLWLSDEDAKLNLNALTSRLPQQRRQLLSQLLDLQHPLQLDPSTTPSAKQQKRWFSSWGQVVDLRQLGQPGAINGLMELNTELTCWGNQKLNLHRTSDHTLRIMVSQLINQEVAQKLLETREEATDIDWRQLLKGLALKRRDELALRTWLTDESSCYSLWLELEDGQRRWYHQWVQGDRTSTTSDSILSFRW